MNKKIVLMFLLILCLFIAPIKMGAVTDAKLIKSNPGEDSSHEIGISWHMDLNKTEGRVEYTKKTDTTWVDAKIVYGDKVKVDVFHQREFYHYTATLRDLDASTEYMYKVGQDTLSEIYYFKTAGSDTFNFLWVSDWHAYTPLPGRTNNVTNLIKNMLIIESDIDFIFSTGDDLAYGSDYEAYEYLYAQSQYKTHMFASTVGNHDVMKNINGINYPDEYTDEFFKRTHFHPQNGYPGQEGASYYFKYGTVLFIVLNSEDVKKKTPLDSAKAWVKEVIDNNPAQYIAVAMHYQWFDGRSGATNAQYTDWRYFFDENKVDLAMAGNNHIYIRTNRIYNDQQTGTEKGTVYMQAPSSDGERGITNVGEFNRNTHIIEEIWSQGQKTIGGMIVRVTPEGISHELIDGLSRLRAEGSFNSRYKDYDFDKEAFLNSIALYSNGSDDVIAADEEGLLFTDKIDYYENDVHIGTNHFNTLADTTFKIDVLDYNNIKAKVSFLDGTIGEVNLINKEYYNLENLAVKVTDGQLELTWEYLGDDEFNLYVYEEDILLKEVSVNDLSVKFSGLDFDTKFTIKPKIDSNISYYNVMNNIFGDVNLDNKVDTDDLKLLIEHISGKNSIDSNLYNYASFDVDGDNEITLLDLTYLHLFVNGLSDKSNKHKVTIKFYNQNNYVIKIVEVYRGDDVIPPNLKDLGDLIHLGWDKDLNNVGSDLDVKPILLR